MSFLQFSPKFLTCMLVGYFLTSIYSCEYGHGLRLRCLLLHLINSWLLLCLFSYVSSFHSLKPFTQKETSK